MALGRFLVAAFVASSFPTALSGDEVLEDVETCEAVRGSALIQRGVRDVRPLFERTEETPRKDALVHRGDEAPNLDAKTRESVLAANAATFAVFTRAITTEMPYLEAFIKHYRTIGVEHFYVLSNMIKDLGEVENFLRDLKIPGAEYTFFYSPGGADDILVAEDWLAKVTQDYVVNVDVDEYWVLPDGVTSLQDLASKRPADAWIGDWAVIVSDDMRFDLRPPYNAISIGGTKYIGKREKMRDLFGIHKPNWKRQMVVDNLVTSREDGGQVVHFWGRSFMDATAKGIAQFFRDGRTYPKSADKSGAYHGCEGLNRTLELADEGNLPERLKLVAFYTSLPTRRPEAVEVIKSQFPLLTVDSKLELEESEKQIGKNMDSVLQKLRKKYMAFKECIQEPIAAKDFSTDNRPSTVSDWLETLKC